MLLGAVAALSITLLAGPGSARAETTTYCAGNLGSAQYCFGAKRWLHQTYGWGDQAGVCVGIAEIPSEGCTSSAGVGVYSTNVGSNVFKYPSIRNNSVKTNFVHGIALS
jgi:hypothetical protein